VNQPAFVTTVIFDWAGTLMRDLGLPGPMGGWPQVEAIPGSLAALGALQGRTACYVASGVTASSVRDVAAALARVELDRHVLQVFTARDLGVPKASPAYYQALLARIQAAPDACVMVGDGYETDVLSARAAGLRTVWFAEGDRGGRAPEAEATIHHLDELLTVLERMGLPPLG
jgi:FMN phosphatase YigB (HAD superfamily)